MPRTKTTTTTELIHQILKTLESDFEQDKKALKEYLDQIDTKVQFVKMLYDEHLQKSIEDIRKEKSTRTIVDDISVGCSRFLQIANKRKPMKRSLSLNDEGYGTGESNDFSHVTNSEINKSRNHTKLGKNERRRSKSLSKADTEKKVRNIYKTPYTQNISTTFGVVTPKCEPNAPQVILRRPKVGEMALSLQGSPLMVGTVIGDEKANVNIPLPDGRMISILPQYGLRTSQIPRLDEEALSQIQTLRDNLEKVSAFSKEKY